MKPAMDPPDETESAPTSRDAREPSRASVKATIAFPLFECGPDAPARHMTMEQLVALEQDAQTADDLRRVHAPNELAGELLAIGKDCADRLDASTRDVDHGDWLYDAKGLPR